MGNDSVTVLLQLWREGQQQAFEQLIALVYDDLRDIAVFRMRALPSGHVLQPTALANEVFLRLVDASQVQWHDRAHFFAIASRLMRQIAVEHFRSSTRIKRGGGWQRIEWEEQAVAAHGLDPTVLAVDEALNRLATLDERKARVVEMRYFGGMDNLEIARVLNVSVETVKRDWRFCKLWLATELSTES